MATEVFDQVALWSASDCTENVLNVLNQYVSHPCQGVSLGAVRLAVWSNPSQFCLTLYSLHVQELKTSQRCNLRAFVGLSPTVCRCMASYIPRKMLEIFLGMQLLIGTSFLRFSSYVFWPTAYLPKLVPQPQATTLWNSCFWFYCSVALGMGFSRWIGPNKDEPFNWGFSSKLPKTSKYWQLFGSETFWEIPKPFYFLQQLLGCCSPQLS